MNTHIYIRNFIPAFICTLLLSAFSMQVYADSQDGALTAEDILELLKNEGVITEAQAKKAANIAKNRRAELNQAPVDYTSEAEKDKPDDVPSGVTRVPYVPEYIRNEIRDSVRLGLREDVIDDVMSQARNESWGVPGTNPDWTKRIKLKGDMRFRYQADRFGEGNFTQYRDYNSINDAGGIVPAGIDAFLNTTENRDRLRLRMRLAMDATITQGIKATVRISSGGDSNPVSVNQTLGGYGNRYQLALDRAYIRFNSIANDYELYFGRMPNPWMTTSQLVWDTDLNFDGVAYSYYFNRSDDMFDGERQFDPFLTLGVFPLQEVKLSSKDKWLLGAQTGFEYVSDAQNKFKVALAYYNFLNISGVQNAPDSIDNNYTAPPYVQKGNTMYDISNSTLNPELQLFALLPDYKELNLSAYYDIASLAPIHIILSAEYVKNIGFDNNKNLARAGGTVNEKSTGYDIGIKAGWPTVTQRGNWNVSLHYRYLERDAVVDAFTDSDFHLGGTDGKGYKFSYSYGIEENSWLELKLISADEIDGPPLGVTTVFTDLNVKF